MQNTQRMSQHLYIFQLQSELKKIFPSDLADVAMTYVYIYYTLSVYAYESKNICHELMSSKSNNEIPLLDFYKQYAKRDNRKYGIGSAHRTIKFGLYNQANLGSMIYHLPLEEQWIYVEQHMSSLKKVLTKHLLQFQSSCYPRSFTTDWIEYCKNIKKIINNGSSGSFYILNTTYVGSKCRIKKLKNITIEANIGKIILEMKQISFFWGSIGTRYDEAIKQASDTLDALEFEISSTFHCQVEGKTQLDVISDIPGVNIQLTITK